MENVDRNLEEQIKSLCDRTSLSMDRKILSDLAGRLPKSPGFTPTPMSAGIWRTTMISKRVKMAAAALVSLAIMLPIGYGAVRVAKRYFTIAEESVTFEYPEPNGTTSYVYARKACLASTDAASEQEAQTQLEEFFWLHREGKAREIKPGVWQATLSNGEESAYGGNPENGVAAFTEEEKARLQQQSDEINALRKAGKGERTFLKEVEENGMKIRLYEVRYTLSDGRVVTITEGVGPDGEAL